MTAENNGIQILFKRVLVVIFKSMLEKGFIEINELSTKLYRTSEEIKALVSALASMGMIVFINQQKTKIKLSENGRRNLKVVLTGGVFDLLHVGHIKTLESAKELGDFLIVIIAADDVVRQTKGRDPLNSQEKRITIIKNLCLVDHVYKGKAGGVEGSAVFYDVVEELKPDIIALGYDQSHHELEIIDKLRERGLGNIIIQRLDVNVPNEKSSEKLKSLIKYFSSKEDVE